MIASATDSPRFCVAINCIDGRAQLPVIAYLQQRFNIQYVDTITEPGVNRLLAEQRDTALIDSVLARLSISMTYHHPVGIAIAAHHDCAANPTSKQQQIQHLNAAVKFIAQHHQNHPIIALWVDEYGRISEQQF